MNRLPRVVRVSPAGDFSLNVWFDTGEFGQWRPDFRHRYGPMAEPLHDAEFVARAFVDEGAVAWPNGFDASAGFIRTEMEQAGTLKGPQMAAE